MQQIRFNRPWVYFRFINIAYEFTQSLDNHVKICVLLILELSIV